MPARLDGGPPNGRRTWTLRLALAAGSVALTLLLIELLLLARVLPVSYAAGKYVYGCYEKTQPARHIHGSLRPLKVGIHRPRFTSNCYSAGHSWRHRSDAYGWRNPQTWDSAEVVLLGDSMIYGHGVEENQTLAHFLRESTGVRVVNMGMVGGSPVHYLAYLNNFALPLDPKVVVVFTFGNDLWDIRARRPMSKIMRFVRTGEGREAGVFSRSDLLEGIRYYKHPAAWHDRFALSRLLEYHVRAWRAHRQLDSDDGNDTPAAPAAPPRQLPAVPEPPPARVLDEMEGLPTVQYLRRAFLEIAASTQAAGVDLVVGHIGKRTNVDWMVRRALEDAAAAQGVHYFDVPELVGTGFRLPNDGHLNENGHRTLADALTAYLDDRRLLETGLLVLPSARRPAAYSDAGSEDCASSRANQRTGAGARLRAKWLRTALLRP